MASKFEEPKHIVAKNDRKSVRSIVAMRAELLVSSGPRFKVSVIDLSRTGFCIETGNHIAVGVKVYLNIPGMLSLQARVAWRNVENYGCEFAYPLHQSIFEHVAKLRPTVVS